MTRPSKNTDRLLIEAGKKMAPKAGFAALSIRKVCAEADVNLGMFHYHFKNKDNFIRALLSEMYRDIISDVTRAAAQPVPPIERLHDTLLIIGKAARDNRNYVVALAKDILNGNRQLVEFAKKNMTAHVGIVAGLALECQKNGTLVKMPIPKAVIMLVGITAMPNLAMEFMDRAKATAPMGIPFTDIKDMFMTDDAIEERVRFAINALSTGRTK